MGNEMKWGAGRNCEKVHTLGKEMQDMWTAVDLRKILPNPTR